MRHPGRRSIPAQCFATGLCLLLCLPAPALALSDAQQLVVEAWRLVNQSYVDPAQLEAVQWRRLRQKALETSIASSVQAYGAIEAMLAPIGDPYTRMLRPEEYATLRSNTQGRVTGVGLQLGLRAGDQRIVVIAPLDASPAADAGIVSGTEILKVDGIPADVLGLEGTAARLRGPAGSDVLLALRTPAGQPTEVLLDRREVDLQPVRSHRLQSEGHSLGYLRITQFSEPVPQQVRSALAELTAAGGSGPIEGLILDLRNNSGGLVAAGLAVADGLLDGDPIVETQDRGGIAARQQATPGRLYGGPMLTLVNAGTASASEILAGALQDSGRSRLAGSRTFGKGLIQTLINLSDGSGLAVTVARYLTPSGRDIQNQGIEPDVLLPQPEPLEPDGDGDSWRQAAATLLVAELAAPALEP
ncbi:peptidase S41 [Cyanobium sp. Cruz CV13-4-11]|uniref:carboxyl-terminal processing protease CtpZ n=1 Tax=unclassified Cyanobium TaxID=2627006 RepID=UPI0020CE8AA0|nr:MULTISPECIES: carboxyl-terminal processing protease CtpZ [unclassified Cyanobium]MCP9901061.1 peptidase S41 [Cyanobium sp. Cruz CV11-17]MCP9920319.1 peptidase S41 [Cyanobium sp. Cruz CV13-4-11]